MYFFYADLVMMSPGLVKACVGQDPDKDSQDTRSCQAVLLYHVKRPLDSESYRNRPRGVPNNVLM